MKKRIFYVFLFIFSVIFLSLAHSIEARDIGLDEMQDYLELPQLDTRRILDDLTYGFRDEWLDSIVSPNSPNETGAILILAQKSVQVDALSYFLVEIPIKTLKAVYKTVLFFNSEPEMYDLLDKFEEFTVEQAKKYAFEWLLQKQVKIGTGSLCIDYAGYSKGAEHIVFPYTLTYMPTSVDNAEVDIKIYSANSIEPPKPTYNYPWLGNDGEKISPFIIHIKGRVQKGGFHTYKWLGEPDIAIEFSNDVPELHFSNMSMVAKTEENVIKGMGILNKVIEVTKGIVDKVKASTSLVFNKVKSIVLGNAPSGGGASLASQPESASAPAPVIDKSPSTPSSNSQTPEKASASPPPSSYAQPKTSPKTEPKPLYSDIQGTIDEISRKIALITQKINALKLASAGKMVLGESVETEEEIEIIKEKEKEQEKSSNQNLSGLIISEVCAGLDKSGNEFIELYNSNNFPVSINDDNFILKIVNSNNTATKKKIQWYHNEIPAKGFFLLVGGKIVVNGQTLSPDATFSSQISSTSGVIITDKQGSVLDRLAWSSSEKMPPPDAVETQGLTMENGLKTGYGLARRYGSGLIDSNNNSQDFTLENELTPTNSLGQKGIYKKTTTSSGSSQYSDYTYAPNSVPTPPKPAPQVLITEISIVGSDDLVELHNPTGASQDLGGSKLRKKTQNGSEYSLRSIPEGTFIGPGDYLLWASSKNGYHLEVGAELSSSAYLSSNNSIVLISDGGSLVDAVAWGEGHVNPYVEGSAFSGNPVSGQSIGRKWDGSNYQDTGNNANDLELQFLTPGTQNQVFQDVVAPDTEIINNPAELTNETIAEFAFSASENDCSFECLLDEDCQSSGSWQSCQSLKSYTGLNDGEHNFCVRAIDKNNNIDDSPAEYSWTVDTTPPITTISLKPPELTSLNTADFVFSCFESNCSFECGLDGGSDWQWQNCQSPQNYSDLGDGGHIFSVRATDVVGNTEIEPAVYAWAIDTSVELPILILSDMDSGSDLYTNQPEINISITNDNEAVAWFLSESINEPLLDSVDWALARPMQAMLSSEDSVKTLYLWTKDVAGNVSFGVSDSIILDTQLPTVEFNNISPIQGLLGFDIGWVGQDNGSGIDVYDLKIWEDLSPEPDDWQTMSVSSYEFTGENGKTYNFRIRAQDKAGNLSEWTSAVSTQILQPILHISPQLPEKLEFSAIEFGESPVSQNLAIENTGFGSLEWEIEAPEASWLILDIAESTGALSSGELLQIGIGIEPTDLAAGQYSAGLEVSSNGGFAVIDVALNILPDMVVPVAPTNILPVSGQVFGYSPIVISGEAEPNALVLIDFNEIRVDEQGYWEVELPLIEGENQFNILVRDGAGNQSEIIGWQCSLVIPKAFLEILSESEIEFSDVEQDSENPASISIMIKNSGAVDMAWQAESIENWIVFESDESGALMPDEAFEIEVSADITGLLSGQHEAEITITAPSAGNSPQTILAILTILEPPPPIEYSLRDVVISEIAWMGTSASADDEWVELYNNNDTQINLSGWTLIAEDGSPNIALDGLIEPNGFYLLERTSDNTISDILADKIYTGALNNDGEILELKDGVGNLIDSVDCSSGWFAGDNGDGDDEKMTMERIDSIIDGSESSNWADNNSQDARNGLDADGNFINGTPRIENSAPAEPVEGPKEPEDITDEQECLAAGYYWYGEVCHEEPEEPPTGPESFFWAQFQKDSRRSGYSNIVGPENLDNRETIFDGYVGDVITTDNGDICFAAEDGIHYRDSSDLINDQWFFEEPGVVGLVGADNGTILALSNKIVALDQLGNELWVYQLSKVYSELKPVASGSKIYILNRCWIDGDEWTGLSLFAFDITNGHLDWVFDTTAPVGTQLYQSPDFRCEALGSSSGQYISSPAVGVDGTIFFGDRKNLYAVSSTGNLIWEIEFDVNRISSASIGPYGVVYVVTDKLLAIDPEDGGILWEQPLGKSAEYGPSFSQNNNLYVWSWRGESRVYAINPFPDTPEPLSPEVLAYLDADTIGNFPSLSDILVSGNAIFFVGNATGTITNIYAFDYQLEPLSQTHISNGAIIRGLAMSPDGTLFVPGRNLTAISP